MTTRTRKAKPFNKIPKTYKALCNRHTLRPVNDKVDWENATDVIHMLAGHDLNKDQEDYLEALSTLVGVYEDEHHAMALSHISPRQVLNSLVEDNDMTASALGELLGNRSLGSKLLRGERELSKVHIRTLADHFKLNASIFI